MKSGKSEITVKQHKNPKRVRREIEKAVSKVGIATKAQQAMKLQQEQNKCERKTKSKLQRKEEDERLFAMRQEKRKEKHKGH